MKITNVNNTLYNNNYKQSFGNSALLTSAFMAINNHEIIGVSTIDLCSMVIPRSLIDFTRNKEAGIETSFREGSSTAINASIGLSGLGAAALLSQGLKKKNYNVDFKKITANDDTIDGLARVFKQTIDENPQLTSKEDITKKFLNKVFEDVKGLAGNAENGDKELWYSLKSDNQFLEKGQKTINTKQNIIDIFLEQQKNNKSYSLNSDTLRKLEAYMNIDIPSTQNLQVKLANKTLETKGSLFLSDVHSLTKAFTQDNVIATFKNAKDSASVEFIKDLKKLNSRKTILGLTAISAIALSIQSFNRHLTKKRTGKDGFVGDPDYDKKIATNSTKQKDNTFVPLKILTMLGMGFFIFKTLNASSLKDLASKIEFKGNLPTINQIKVVYGSTILGRLFAASDKNELRESAFRDFLGFTNFLVLGALVTKCFVNWKDKTLINYDPKTHGKGLLNWLKNSTIKTHQEVINDTLKHNSITEKGVLPLKELYKKNWIQPDGTIAKRLSTLNKANLIGILYSCVALGIIVPLINKHMTARKKKAENQQATENKTVQTVQTSQIQQQNLDSSKLKKQQIITDYLNAKK